MNAPMQYNYNTQAVQPVQKAPNPFHDIFIRSTCSIFALFVLGFVGLFFFSIIAFAAVLINELTEPAYHAFDYAQVIHRAILIVFMMVCIYVFNSVGKWMGKDTY